MNDIDANYRRITGFAPYAWQQRLTDEGLPQTLEIPTGCGKTAAVFMAWAYRRRLHPDAAVRQATPRRLVFVLPQRSLVEQTVENVRTWIANAGWSASHGEDHLPVHVLMGGESVGSWQLEPHRDAVIIGTLDMVLSRTLNRGYAMNRYAWPVDFGLLNNDCHYVLDEVQLMGAAATTSRQLDAFRSKLGTAIGCSTTWMSATLDLKRLSTVDNPVVAEPFKLEPDEITESLAKRLGAERTVQPWLTTGPDDRPDNKQFPALRAEGVAQHHRPGSLTLVVTNQVDVARELHKRLGKLVEPGTELVLLHSRFRPADRAAQMARVLADPPPAGTIVVTTQVVEAGIDLNATTLFTEVAPWSSIVQRSGRCNRDGRIAGARLFWDPPANPAPYLAEDLAAAEAKLIELSGSAVSTGRLDGLEVAEVGGEEPLVLRHRDLMGLFDTTPDLTGNDLDIAPFLRSGDDLSVWVCWRDLKADEQPTPERDELCQVPVGQIKDWVKKKRAKANGHVARRLDHVGRGRTTWVNLGGERVRPGMVLLVDAALGGYRPDTGWDPRAVGAVAPPTEAGIAAAHNDRPDLTPLDERESDEPATFVGHWMSLETHLIDAGREAGALMAAMDTPGLAGLVRNAAVRSARLHDLGKAHPVFQETLRKSAGDEPIPISEPWAKSKRTKASRHSRPYFRHELASALALLGGARGLIEDDAEQDLICYLVAAHHGKIRLAIRAMPEERIPADVAAPEGARIALGVIDGDELPEITVDGQTIGPIALDLGVMEAGTTSAGPSWTTRSGDLVQRADLGPFRLGYLEAIVRVADWRASALTEEQR